MCITEAIIVFCVAAKLLNLDFYSSMNLLFLWHIVNCCGILIASKEK